MTRWHWKEYAIEAAGLGVLLLAACASTVFIEHPQSRAAALLPWLRRALMGAAMGLTAAALKSLVNRQRACAIHGRECHQGLFARNLYVGQRSPLAGVAHQNGAIRFGHDPRTSALDPRGKAHELDNLYVVDASFFPSSGAVNPALTIMANALRVGDHLAQRL
jgi:choline dehydrogenase-like flavoprotein